MARKQPIAAPAEIQARSDQAIITQVREYKLITPLFGGGVEPGEADPVTVIRASEIRGHLRFWWRATRGGQFGGKLEDMKAAEDALWGSASTKDGGGPSLVQVEVEALSKPEAFKPIDQYGIPVPYVGMPKSRHSYATFPLNEKRGEVQIGISFKLRLRYPDLENVRKGLEASLWAWETFGGIGGRTRRGLGAISRLDSKELLTISEFREEFTAKVNQLISEGVWHLDVPHLSSEAWRYVLVDSSDDNNWKKRLTDHKEDSNLAMWDFLINKLREFRQDRPRNGNRFGRSRWPEADALREQVGRWANYTDFDGKTHDHRSPLVTLNGHTIKVIPRAVFGLPLIFQFKDNNRTLARDTRRFRDVHQIPPPPRDADPEQITIEGGNFNRWASPLIMRPVQCSDGVIGLAAVLYQPPINPSHLKASGAPGMPIRLLLTQQEAQKIPMLNGQSDVLITFLKYLKGQ